MLAAAYFSARRKGGGQSRAPESERLSAAGNIQGPVFSVSSAFSPCWKTGNREALAAGHGPRFHPIRGPGNSGSRRGMAGARGGNCQTACKPGSVRTCFGCGTTIPLGRASQRASRDQPGRRGGNAPALLAGRRRPYSVLLPVGLTLPPLLPGARCALAAPFRPCLWVPPGVARRSLRGRFVFCGTVPGSPPRAVGRHRIPVEPGLSSTVLRRQRPSGRLAGGEMRGDRGASSVRVVGAVGAYMVQASWLAALGDLPDGQWGRKVDGPHKAEGSGVRSTKKDCCQGAGKGPETGTKGDFTLA